MTKQSTPPPASLLRSYYVLIKPGIVRGNAMMAAAGFLFAVHGHFDTAAFIALTLGTSLIIASSCVINNVLDRDIDAKMKRTKTRAIVQKTIPIPNALIYAVVLAVVGYALLVAFTNWLVVLLGATAMALYVLVYTPLKKRSVHGTLVGSLPGAIPPMAGYAAATGHFNLTAVLLGVLLVSWQMPHFYAIAIFRGKEYASAKVPVMPLVKGIAATKKQIMIYIVLFAGSVALLSAISSAGIVFAVVGLYFAASWFRLGLITYKTSDDVAWARAMFGKSLVVLSVMTVLLALNSILP